MLSIFTLSSLTCCAVLHVAQSHLLPIPTSCTISHVTLSCMSAVTCLDSHIICSDMLSYLTYCFVSILTCLLLHNLSLTLSGLIHPLRHIACSHMLPKLTLHPFLLFCSHMLSTLIHRPISCISHLRTFHLTHHPISHDICCHMLSALTCCQFFHCVCSYISGLTCPVSHVVWSHMSVLMSCTNSRIVQSLVFDLTYHLVLHCLHLIIFVRCVVPSHMLCSLTYCPVFWHFLLISQKKNWHNISILLQCWQLNIAAFTLTSQLIYWLHRFTFIDKVHLLFSTQSLCIPLPFPPLSNFADFPFLSWPITSSPLLSLEMAIYPLIKTHL